VYILALPIGPDERVTPDRHEPGRHTGECCAQSFHGLTRPRALARGNDQKGRMLRQKLAAHRKADQSGASQDQRVLAA
jgi:hypothetical protein